MNHRVHAAVATVVLAALAVSAGLHSQDRDSDHAVARGVVFHDQNGNQRRDTGEPGLPGVRVSNGRDIVKTDEQGRYRLPVSDDTIVFVIKPREWRTPVRDNQTPLFYYIHKPDGSPQSKFPGVAPTGPLPASIDFPLYPQKEPDQFKALLFGDPQPRDQREIDYIAHDVVEELIGTDASFGVTLGDILFDDLSLFEAQAQCIALLGIPWYNVLGNHDINKDARNDRTSDETFERHFGPSYYSFDYGTVHFIVLDDVEWYIPEPGGNGKYRGGLGEAQMEFVRQDLALVPEQQLVVLMMHIPLVDVADRQELYRLIEQRPFCISISGHTHHHEHRFITRADGWRGPEPHHHIINVTVSGSWWSGASDDRLLPHTMCADGTPNGYSIISFDGTKYSLDYRAAGRSADYQMQITAPEAIAADATADAAVYVNVFNGSARSTVEMRVDDSHWSAMRQTREPDPAFVQIVETEKKLLTSPWRRLPAAKPSSHLWKAALPENLTPGSHLIEVRTTDMFGQTYSGRRVFRVISNSADGTASAEKK